jgi:C1A family cysteine protease
MDMPEEEFMKQRGGLSVDDASHADFKKLPKASMKKTTDFLSDKVTGGSKDWSADGMTTAIKDQGQCGSCWAFSTTEQVESMAIKAGITDDMGENYVLGPQELVSCDHNGDMGCNGGLPLNALKWLETKPLEQESDYPYRSGLTGASGKCRMKQSKGVMEVTSFKQISASGADEDDLQQYLLNEGPASVGVDANNQWQTYIGGVMHAYQCMGRMDHAVQAVGIDLDAATPYIKVRNSWADSWGEEGFIRLKAGTNTCGVANMAVTADVQKVGGNTINV